MRSFRDAVVVIIMATTFSACNDRTTLRPPAWNIEMAGHQAVMVGSLHSTPAGMTQKLPDLPSGWPMYVEAVKSQKEGAARAFLRNAVGPSPDDGPLEKMARSRLKDQPGVAELRTWALAYVTSSRSDYDKGRTDGPGTEAIIDPQGRASPLEDPGLIYGDLAAMTKADQREYLEEALAGSASCRQDMTTGRLDEAALIACVSRRHGYLRMFLDRRNARMCSRMAAVLRKGNAVFAIGAGHVFGRRSLLSCMESKGARVTRIS